MSCGTLPRIIVNLNHCKGATASDCVVITDSLTRVHGDATALSGLTLLVQEHSIFGFPGPIGAGKTTAMRLLFGLSFSSATVPSYANLTRR